MLTEKITIAEKIGNFVSLLLLGNTKEAIIRLYEKVGFLQKSVDKLENRLDQFNNRLDQFGGRLDRFESRFDKFYPDMKTI